MVRMVSLALAFLPFAIITGFTPGPNNLMLAASGANFGIRRTLPHALGIVCGFPLLVLVTGLGLGTVFETRPEAHAALKVVGAAGLIYLAWRIATAGLSTAPAAPARPLTFLEAVLFQWVNPKAWVFALSAIATYTTVDGPASVEVAIILAVCAAVSIGSTITWTVFGAGLSLFMQNSPRAQRAFNLGMALLLLLSIVPVAT